MDKWGEWLGRACLSTRCRFGFGGWLTDGFGFGSGIGGSEMRALGLGGCGLEFEGGEWGWRLEAEMGG